MSKIHDVKNDKETRTSILDMAMGGIKERADYEMSKIIDNIQDINVPAKKARSLIIQIDFEPDEGRRKLIAGITVKSKLTPTAPISTMLVAAPDANGEMVYREATLQTPGQIDMFGGVQSEPAELRLVENK